MGLDHGAQGTAALQALYRTLTRPSFGQKPCPFCDDHFTEPSHFEHFITCHTPFVSSEFIVELLIREHRYFCTCQAFSASCILLTLFLVSCYSFTLHLLYTSCYAMLASYASTFEPWTFEPLKFVLKLRWSLFFRYFDPFLQILDKFLWLQLDIFWLNPS